MKATTIDDFKRKTEEHLDAVYDDQDVLVVVGPKDAHFVVLPLEVYQSWKESAYLTSTVANTRRLMESIAQDQAGTLQR